MSSILAAAGRYIMAEFAGPLAVTVAMAGLVGIASANAADLTPEQQALVKKYNISKSDQEKLFGAQAATAGGRETQSAFAEEKAGNSAPYLFKGTYIFGGGETYKSLGERITNINGGTGSLTGSFGGVVGFNSGFTLPDSNVGVQVGASYGHYDPKGRLRLVPDASDPETQLYYTVGVYKRGNMSEYGGSLLDRLSLGLVYDGLEAERWGVNANSIRLGQVRGTVGFALSNWTEIGAWGTYDVNSDDAAVTVAGAPGVRRQIRAMNQANLYVKQHFDFGGDIMAYAGKMDAADIGNWQVGLTGRMPLSNNWSTYASANYVIPDAPSGPDGSGEEQFSASFGIAYHFGGNAASKSVTGNRYLPLQDVASNRTFLITD